MTLVQASRWMQTGSTMIVGFGVLVALGAYPSLNGMIVFLADMMIWPLDDMQTGNSSEFKFLAAVGGATMIGWGITLWVLCGRGLREAPELSKSIIYVSITVWFVVDCVGSVFTGAPLNVIGNLGFLAIFLFPLRSIRSSTVVTNPIS